MTEPATDPSTTPPTTTTPDSSTTPPTTTTETTQTSDKAAAAPEAGSSEKSLLNQEEPAAPEGAPDAYKEFKVPDGFELDKDALGEAHKVFKELNLNQDGAQKLIDFYANKTKEALDAPFKLWRDTQEQWVDAVKKDPDIGPKLSQVKQTISKAIDNLGDAALSKSFREAMDITGAGNHPAVFKALAKLAEFVTEGKHVSGGNPSPLGQRTPGDSGRPSVAKALYPNNP